MITSTNTGGAGVEVTPEDLRAIEAETARSRVGYRVEVDQCSESGRPMVHVEADREGLSVSFLPNNAGNSWGALDHRGEELATGETIRTIVQENGARLFV